MYMYYNRLCRAQTVSSLMLGNRTLFYYKTITVEQFNVVDDKERFGVKMF